MLNTVAMENSLQVSLSLTLALLLKFSLNNCYQIKRCRDCKLDVKRLFLREKEREKLLVWYFLIVSLIKGLRSLLPYILCESLKKDSKKEKLYKKLKKFSKL